MIIANEYFRVILNGTKAEFDCLENHCKAVSKKVDDDLRSEHQRANRTYEPLNSMMVYISDYNSSYTNIILYGIFSVKVRDMVMNELKAMGYKVDLNHEANLIKDSRLGIHY